MPQKRGGTEIKMTLAEKIFTLRRKNGLSQDDLANELGVSRQAVYKWESGNSTPEIDKIKMLSKLFKVSFDYLLDDSIDDYETADGGAAKSERAQVSYRTVFCVGGKKPTLQSSIDHGFIDKKRDVSMAESYFNRRMIAANKALDEAGATEKVFFKPTETTAWFYDEKRRAIGFYYEGRIQFVCPIENILSFNVYDGGQALINKRTGAVSLGVGFGGGVGVGLGTRNDTDVVERPSRGVLSYYDGGSVKDFELILSPNDIYMADTVAMKQGEEFMKLLFTRNRTAIENNFDLLKQRIEALKVVVATEERTVEDVDVEFYTELNKKYIEDYQNFKKRILDPKAFINPNTAAKKEDPNRIKLDQTVPEKPKSESEMLKIPLIVMGIVVAAILIIMFWF